MISRVEPSALGGYVLAGGRSSRMGADKALIELAGKPLLQRAAEKLRRTCAAVHILGSNPAFAEYGPLVDDVHPDCGPAGGMEAALLHSASAWNLFLAVDMPLLPLGFIRAALERWRVEEREGACIRLFLAGDRPQPGFCLLHRNVGPYLSAAIARGDYKLMRVFEEAASGLGSAVWKMDEAAIALTSDDITQAQRAARRLWFANLNTPEEFAEAESHADVLDG
jgi:molybdopterin-guanine dinucleotide biosynthesis protein A